MKLACVQLQSTQGTERFSFGSIAVTGLPLTTCCIMVLLTMTQAMVDVLKYLKVSRCMVSDEHGDVSADSCLDNPQVGAPISHEQIINLAKTPRALAGLSSDGSQDHMPSCRLEHLLRGARVYVEPPKPKSTPVGDAVTIWGTMLIPDSLQNTRN